MSAERVEQLAHVAVGAVRAARNPQDDDEAITFLDRVDQAKPTHAETPERGAAELRDPGRARLTTEGEDRGTQRGGVAWRQAVQLAPGRWRELDAARPGRPGFGPGHRSSP
jgi:hypothetical protein